MTTNTIIGISAVDQAHLPKMIESIHSKVDKDLGIRRWEGYTFGALLYLCAPKSLSFAAIEEREGKPFCTGYICAFPQDDGAVYIPYMATTRKCSGIGFLLFSALVEKMKKSAYNTIRLECREGVIGFYSKMAGRVATSCSIEEVGIYGDSKEKRFSIQMKLE